MPWELNSDKPVYLQLIEQVKRNILSGKYVAGEKLPSVRDLAAEAAVNPNTMQRALVELEREGLLYAERTSGRFITDNKELIKAMKKEMVIEEVKQFMERMKTLGFEYEDIIRIIESQKQN
ncbi:GntR family transcriptional regulator [Clostridium sp. Marseille-P299]|uniref:GntR family transcriptional regulator n=1 Tax=Clostridium sp. Marseille-P299 TaxID=1805477 RepID=UPI0008364C74|nr:GntR family transcriptional regulator [Clostridium sp. Marseille-P299]